MTFKQFSEAFRYDPIPSDWSQNKETYEDRQWDEMMSGLKFVKETTEIGPGMPLSLYTNSFIHQLTLDEAERVTKSKAVIYVMNVFSYEDIWGSHQTEVCGYLYGESNQFHLRHKHNSW